MRQLLRRAWYLLRQRRFDADLQEELEFHRAASQRELEQSRTDPTEARFAARRALGSVTLAQDQARDVWTPRWLQGVGQDVRLAFRTLRATPIVTTVAVLSLALGIGANSAIFSIINSLILRSLPVKEANRLVLVTTTVPGVQAWSYPVWDQIRQRPELFDGVAAWSLRRFNLAPGGETLFVDGLYASGSFFDTLGVPAILGRTFSEVDDQPGGGVNGPVAVISYGFWQRHFGGAGDVIGRTLALGKTPFTIIGVTPADFFGVEVGRAFDVAVPLADSEPGGTTTDRANLSPWLTIVARLNVGQTVDRAAAALRGQQLQIREATIPMAGPLVTAQFRDQYLKAAFTLVPAATGSSALRRQYEQPLVVILVVVVLVLLIACANLANLLLARLTARQHELSVRRALGASRWRLARQLLVESTVLAVSGAALGLLVALWGSRLLVRQLSTQITNQTTKVFVDLSLDWRVVAFTVGMTVMTALLFGATSAFRASGTAPIDALKQGGRNATGQSRGLASSLVIAQVALSVVLVVAAGLLVRTFAALATLHLGFERDRVLVVEITASDISVSRAQRLPLFERALDAVRGLTEVANAAASLTTPVSGRYVSEQFTVSGAAPLPEDERVSLVNHVSPGWFRTLRTPLVAGRDFSDTDRPSRPPVAIVNQTFARRFLNGASPLGHTVGISAGPDALFGTAPREIVGMVADAVYRSVRNPVPPTVYLPFAESGVVADFGRMSLSVRSNGPSAALLTKSVAAAVGTMNPQLTLTFRLLADQIDASMTQERVTALLSGFFGVLALLLAGLGLYGVTACAVSQRQREIGIRMALGASSQGVIRLVLSRVALLVGLGVVLGSIVSLWASRSVASLLYGVEPRDPVTLFGAAVVLATVAAVAGWIPAWRASRIDPAVVLRNE